MNTRKIIRYILISFSISWLVALIIFVFRIPFDSLSSNILVAVLYMTSPAVAALIVQKGIYRQSLNVYGLTITSIPTGRLLMVPAIFVAFLAIFFGIIVVGNQLSDQFASIIFSKEHLMSLSQELVPGKLHSNGLRIPDSPNLLFAMIIGSAIFAGFSLNLPVALGEELGWRGLLAEELRPLGFWRSNLLIGLIWGIWYAPIVLMGFNFPEHPWQGVGIMIMLTTAVSFVLSYLRYKIRTVFAPAAFHGMVNGSSPILFFFFVGGNDLWSSLAGVAGTLTALIATLVIAVADPEFIKSYNRYKGEKISSHTQYM